MILGKDIPPYRMVYEALKKEACKADDDEMLIPSYKRLARQFEVGESTVVRAVNLLKQDGYAYGRQGKGTYLCRRKPQESVLHIAFVTMSLDGDTAHYAKGISSALDNKDSRISLAMYSTHGVASRYNRLVEEVLHSKPDGLIFLDVLKASSSYVGQIVAASRIPAVVIGNPIDGLSADRVIHTRKDSGRLLGKYIQSRGYKNAVPFLSSPVAESNELISQINVALAEDGLKIKASSIIVVDTPHGFASQPDPYIDAKTHMSGLFQDGFRCEALVCGHDYLAVGAIRAAEKHGIKIPQDMKILSGLRCAVDRSAASQIVTVDTRRHEQADIATKLLVRRMHGYDGLPEVHYVPGELVIGGDAN